MDCDNSCKTCADNFDECASCPDYVPTSPEVNPDGLDPSHLGKFLHNKKCIDLPCPSGFYANYAERACTPCDNHCMTCKDAVTCLSCDLNSEFPVLLNSSCVSTCPSDFPLLTSLGCEKCADNCLTC